jgi:hypothetical protein
LATHQLAVAQVLLTEVDEVLGFFQQSSKEELEGYIPGAVAKMVKLDGKIQISFYY